MNTESTTTVMGDVKTTVAKTELKKTIQPLAYGVYYWAAVALTVTGILDSIYLCDFTLPDLHRYRLRELLRHITRHKLRYGFPKPIRYFSRVAGPCLGCPGLRLCPLTSYSGGNEIGPP